MLLKMQRNILLQTCWLAVLITSLDACQNRLEVLVQESMGGAHDLSTDVKLHCNSEVGSFIKSHYRHYSQLISQSLQLSLEYMTMSSHFGRDTVQRPGFQSYFRRQSDSRFEAAIEMIKYAALRGATNVKQPLLIKIFDTRTPVDTLPSLGKALADSKQFYSHLTSLHENAFCISKWRSEETACTPDADLGVQLEAAAGTEVRLINTLASYSNQLSAMFTAAERSMADHVFDSALLN